MKADQRSNTCRNISYISDLTKLNNVIDYDGWVESVSSFEAEM